jgi:hypothetical protein
LESVKEIEQKKEEAREEHYKKKFEFECQKNQVFRVDRMNRRKNDLIKQQEENKLKEEEKRAERDGMPNPFEDEISNCDFLIRYCKKILKDKEQKENKVQKDHVRKEDQAKTEEELKKRAEEGKIQFIKPKKDREREELLVIGDENSTQGKKKNKRKKPQPVKKEETSESKDPNELTFKYEIIHAFSEVGVSPPDTIQDLDEKISDLESKRNDYFERGEKKLDSQFISNNPEAETAHEEGAAKDESKSKEKLDFNAEQDNQELWPSMQ